MKKSLLMAKHRKNMSAPMKYLLQHKLIKGKILDFGCGYGKDVETLLALGYDVSGYDPYYGPVNIDDCLYNTITCHYVLNVLLSDERNNVLNEIKKHMESNGVAYITVRTDKWNILNCDRKTTCQFLVELPLPIITKNKKYCIYELRK